MRVEDIEIEKIVIPEKRAKATFTDEQAAELKASIEKHGFSVPILVRSRPDGQYELIDGQHRIEIVKAMGWTKIPAVITDADDLKANMLNILANTARGSQNAMDVAEALRRAYDAGANVDELAAATGHTQEWVCKHLTLTELDGWVQEAVRNQKLSIGHIMEALELDQPEEVYSALETALQLNWPVSTLRYYVEQRKDVIQRMESAGKNAYVEEPPSVEYAQAIVTYGDCMTCGRKVNRMDLTMPAVCKDCRTLLEWAVKQCGHPKAAMQTLYAALNQYQDMQRRLMNMQIPAAQSTAQPTEQHAQPAVANASTSSSSAQSDDELLALAKKLKALKEAGLL